MTYDHKALRFVAACLASALAGHWIDQLPQPTQLWVGILAFPVIFYAGYRLSPFAPPDNDDPKNGA